MGTRKRRVFRVVTRGADGTLQIQDFHSTEPIRKMHQQVGVEDCSTDLSLRGLPVFRGLIGPMSEGDHIVRYEAPDVFEALTKQWGMKKPRRRTRSASGARERQEPTSG